MVKHEYAWVLFIFYADATADNVCWLLNLPWYEQTFRPYQLTPSVTGFLE